MRGLQCRKSLWLLKYRPDLQLKPDSTQLAIFQAGTDTGVLAQKLFPGGTAIEFAGTTFEEKIEHTQNLIESGCRTIYEATFRYNDVLAMVDILHHGTDGWEIYEVKNSTGPREYHLYDIALQHQIVSESGLCVTKSCLVHINNGYIRNGDIEIEKLFAVIDYTENSLAQSEFIKEEIKNQREMLKQDYPNIDIGPHCTSPHECDFRRHCWEHIPENSIFNLRGNGIDKFEHYRRGIIRLEDVDPEELNAGQRMQLEAELYGTQFINRNGLNEFLNSLSYPLCFLDFEAIYSEAVPPFDGTHPYARIPFQYSLHIQHRPDGELEHHEYLAPTGYDGREKIAANLCHQIPDDACILTYNMSFEKGIVKDLAAMFPDLSAKLNRIAAHMKDLIVPFRRKDYYTREMKGSYSIKYILPALVPELSYNDLDVSHGGDAVLSYQKLSAVDTDEAEAARIRRGLLEYCKLDTLAMVKILEKLREVARENG